MGKGMGNYNIKQGGEKEDVLAFGFFVVVGCGGEARGGEVV